MITNEQRERRNDGIFASDVPRIMDGNSIPLFLEKIGELERPDFDDVLEVEIGHLIEPKILDAYEIERPGYLQRSPDTLLHKLHSFLGCHLDALRTDATMMRHNVEAKSVGTYNRNEWGDGGDEVPDKVLWQVQAQMLVASSALETPITHTEIPVCFVTPENLKLLLTGRIPKINIFVVPSDAELHHYIVTKATQIWNCIQTRELPAPEKPSDVRLLYRRDSGAVLQADESTYQAYQSLMSAREDKKAAAEQEESAKFIVQSFMKDAAELRYEGKTLATWKKAKDGQRCDNDALAAEEPDIYNRFLVPVEGSRRFLPKELK